MLKNIRIFHEGLLEDLVQFGEKQTAANFETKVLRVHRKCIKSGRIFLAEQIFIKHSDCFKIKSDAALAFYWSMLAAKK